MPEALLNAIALRLHQSFGMRFANSDGNLIQERKKIEGDPRLGGILLSQDVEPVGRRR